LNNKIFRINLSGPGGILTLAVLIILGILAITFFAVFIGVVAVGLIAAFIIRKILAAFGVKKKAPAPDIHYYSERVIEEPEYKVEDDDAKPDPKQLN